MKEARVDEILNSIAETCLVYLPTSEPMLPSEFYKANVAYREHIGDYRFSIFTLPL